MVTTITADMQSSYLESDAIFKDPISSPLSDCKMTGYYTGTDSLIDQSLELKTAEIGEIISEIEVRYLINRELSEIQLEFLSAVYHRKSDRGKDHPHSFTTARLANTISV